MLAIAAVLTGGLASVTARRPVLRGEEQPATKQPGAELSTLLDPTSLVEARVEEAEQATDRARAAIRSARQLGVVDDRLLDELEQRLDHVQPMSNMSNMSGAPSSSSSVREFVELDSEPRAL
jgi:hypothetical protein